MMRLQDLRSLLFVPGHRAERHAKAAASGADAVCIDLEDALPPEARAATRAAVLPWLKAQPPEHAFGLRINALPTADGLRDLLALVEARTQPAFAMLAKTEHAAEIELVAAHLPGVPLIALIETARGLHAASAISAAHPQLQALMLGGADLAADLGCRFGWEGLLHARCTLVAAAAAHRLACIDVPFLDVADAEGARAEAQRVAALGFTAKALIHPAQVAPVHAGLMPEPDALARARRVVSAWRGGEADAALLLDGQLIDRPVVAAAQRLLQRAGE